MKATIERAVLLKSLGHVQSVVERRNTIPILSNVLIEADASGQLKLMATDLDLQVVETIAAKVETPGTTTVSAHTLFEIARKLPEGAEVSLAAAEGKMQVKAGRSNFNLPTLPRDDFPVIAEGDLPTSFELPVAELIQIIDKTRFAISTEETRYYLNGIYLHAAKDAKPAVMRAVATDGHRLARYELELPDGAADMPGVIVPRKTVGELRKLLDDADGAIDISLSDTKIQFGFNGVELTSKLIDGNFPPYERVIPSGNDKSLALEAKEFAQSVDRVSTISADKTRAVKLNLSKDKVTLSVVNPESGTATEEVGATYSAGGLEIGFNARYLLDITSQIEGKEVRFGIAASSLFAVVTRTRRTRAHCTSSCRFGSEA